MDVWMYRCMDGWIDGEMDVLTDGYKSKMQVSEDINNLSLST